MLLTVASFQPSFAPNIARSNHPSLQPSFTPTMLPLTFSSILPSSVRASIPALVLKSVVTCGPFPLTTSHSTPMAVKGVKMSLNMMQPSKPYLFTHCRLSSIATDGVSLLVLKGITSLYSLNAWQEQRGGIACQKLPANYNLRPSCGLMPPNLSRSNISLENASCHLSAALASPSCTFLPASSSKEGSS